VKYLSAVFLGILITSLPVARSMAAPASDLWAFWQPQPDTQSSSISHETWQGLLDRYLRTAPDQINRFDYKAVTDDDRSLLTTYLNTLTDLDPRGFPIDEQMAYWINLYNALTVQVVLDHPDKDSILRMGQGLFSFGPWNDKLVTIAGQQVTLNDIEHRILRPIWQDRRIHFAVNCASLGCPNLSANAFTSSNLESMLVSAEQTYLTHPRAISFNSQGELVLSSIFKWYSEDFADNREQLLDYLSQHQVSLATRLIDYTGPIRYQYDWSLNQAR
jgi:hypothetical protein